MRKYAFVLSFCLHSTAMADLQSIDINALVFSKFIGPQSFPNATMHGLLRLVSGDDLCRFDGTRAQNIIYAFRELRCSLKGVCGRLLSSGATALLRITEKANAGRVGYAYRRFLDDRTASCVPHLHAAWLGDVSMSFLASGGELDASIHVESDNPWEEMYSSVMYQIFLRWLPCAEYAILTYGAGVLLWRLRYSPAQKWSTKRVVVCIEFILCLTLSAFFGAGLYYAGESLSWYISALFSSQLIGSSSSTTLLVGIYYRNLRLQTKQQVFRAAVGTSAIGRDPLSPVWRRATAIIIVCSLADLLYLPLALANDSVVTVRASVGALCANGRKDIRLSQIRS
uniref:G protein-coupled receptor n=1 Tax=Chrysotila carterae TaxID=13221 RepID=A0A7S4BRS5_CHRCT